MGILDPIKKSYLKEYIYIYIYISVYLYILRRFRKLVIAFFPDKNTPKLINQ